MPTSSQPVPSNGTGDNQDRYSAIVASLKKFKTSGALKPEFADALTTLNDHKTPTKHTDLLAAAWTVIEQLIHDHQHLIQKRQDSEFLFDIGDWAQAIISPVWERKDLHAKEHQKDLKRYFKKKGCLAVQADKLAKQHSRYPFLGDHINHQLCRRMMAEETEVEEWRKRGEKPSDIPNTPFLDRVVFLCQRESIDTRLFVKLVKTYKKRNDFAHRSPPRMADFVLPGPQGNHAENRINWLGMRTKCDERRSLCQKDFDEGKIKANEKDLFQAAIDRYWLSLGSSWHGQVVIPTQKAKKEAQKVCERYDKLQIAATAWQDPWQGPALPYSKRKWDFLK